MESRTVGIILNGVTGRMGANQHLERSLMAIQRDGGMRAGEVMIMPEVILVGRNEEKLRALSERNEGVAWSMDLEGALRDPKYSVYFDAQTTSLRAATVSRAVAAGKHIYCEKPLAGTMGETMRLVREVEGAGMKNGVVQDKLWLPGIRKLKHLIDTGFFGKILSVRGEFGYWVFTGEDQPAQRPSWNYRAEEGGGIIVDMLCHWRYLVDNLFGNVTSVTCLGTTHVDKRLDEAGKAYTCTADDSMYSTLVTDQGVVCQFNASWCVRVRRDDLLTVQVDGTKGSAVAGLRECRVQGGRETPRPVWNPDIANPVDFYAGWKTVDGEEIYENAFKAQWELFLRHVVLDEPFRWTFREAAKGVQLAEAAMASWKQRRWMDVGELM